MTARLTLRALLFGVLWQATALADLITFSFTSSLLTTTPGQSVTFAATVTNLTSDPVFLNGDNVSIAAPLSVDDTKFLLNFPVFLTSHQAVTAQILDVTVLPSVPVGLYSGTFEILGGTSEFDFDSLASADFGVRVVPEPGNLSVFLAGTICWLLLLTRFKCGHAATVGVRLR